MSYFLSLKIITTFLKFSIPCISLLPNFFNYFFHLFWIFSSMLEAFPPMTTSLGNVSVLRSLLLGWYILQWHWSLAWRVKAKWGRQVEESHHSVRRCSFYSLVFGKAPCALHFAWYAPVQRPLSFLPQRTDPQPYIMVEMRVGRATV